MHLGVLEGRYLSVEKTYKKAASLEAADRAWEAGFTAQLIGCEMGDGDHVEAVSDCTIGASCSSASRARSGINVTSFLK